MESLIQIRSCPNPECGKVNRIPSNYTGIAVCGHCKNPMYETQLRAGKPEKPVKAKRKREFTIRWTQRDWHLVLPVILLSFPIHWALQQDWLDRLSKAAVYMTIITALGLAWLVVGLALKVSWEEFFRAKKEREANPPAPDTIDNLAAWEAASEYARKAREHAATRVRNAKEN